MSIIHFVLCVKSNSVSEITDVMFTAPDKMLKVDIKFTKNFLAHNIITKQLEVQRELDSLGITPTAILTRELRPFKDIPVANRKSVLAECITFLKPPPPRSSNVLPQDYLIDKTNYCSSNIEGCVERIETGYLANTKVIKKVYFFINAEIIALLESKKRLEFAKLLNERLSSDSPANGLPVKIVQNICMGVKFQGGGGKRKYKKKSKRRITKRKYKRKSKRRKSKSKRRRRRSR